MIVGTMLASLLIGSAGAIPPMEHSTAATVTQQERVIVVESRIKRGPSGAERDYGSFTVPANARAAKFSSAEPDFQIYSVEMNGREKVHFDRVKGIDRPVPLAQLTLRPGKYFFSIPGQPGASGKLTFTIRAQ